MANRMYIVTYDLPSTTSSVKRKVISDAIKASGNWWHHIDCSWLIVADKTADEIAMPITHHIKEAHGTLLVMQVEPSNRQGLLNEKGWAWIRTWSNRFRGLPN
jgi:hypothetical protein